MTLAPVTIDGPTTRSSHSTRPGHSTRSISGSARLSYRARIVVRVGLALALTLTGYLILARPARHLEAVAAVAILRALGAHDVFLSGEAMVASAA